MSFPHEPDATDSSALQPTAENASADAVSASDGIGSTDSADSSADVAGSDVADTGANVAASADNGDADASAATELANALAEQTRLHDLDEDALAPAADLPIRLPTFEGPLDLLLFLIRRNEIDIYDIPIESVTKQYMQVLHSMKELNLEVAGDFFVMAATLMYIKSRMLLPTNEQVAQPQEEEEEADPRWELVQQLLEYKKYKEAALELQTLVERRQDFLERYYQQEQISDIERELEAADKIELWNTFNKVLRRLSDRIVKGEIQDEEISISQSMEYILNTIKDRDSFRFSEILVGKRLTVAFLVSTFLAVLELTRLKHLYIVQDTVFGEIECTRRENPNDEGEDITDTEREEAMAPRKAARERKAALAAAELAAASGGTVGARGTDGDDEDDDGFQPGDDDFNWDDFGGHPSAVAGAADADGAGDADDSADDTTDAGSDIAAADDWAEDNADARDSDEADDSDDELALDASADDDSTAIDADQDDSDDDSDDDGWGDEEEDQDEDADAIAWDEADGEDADADWEDDDLDDADADEDDGEDGGSEAAEEGEDDFDDEEE